MCKALPRLSTCLSTLFLLARVVECCGFPMAHDGVPASSCRVRSRRWTRVICGYTIRDGAAQCIYKVSRSNSRTAKLSVSRPGFSRHCTGFSRHWLLCCTSSTHLHWQGAPIPQRRLREPGSKGMTLAPRVLVPREGSWSQGQDTVRRWSLREFWRQWLALAVSTV